MQSLRLMKCPRHTASDHTPDAFASGLGTTCVSCSWRAHLEKNVRLRLELSSLEDTNFNKRDLIKTRGMFPISNDRITNCQMVSSKAESEADAAVSL
jgi:hypothetical protein